MNTSTEIDRIHRQHMEAIDNTLASRRHDLALMISFSLHLALQDLADKLRPSYGADLNAQIIRLTEWLALNVENQEMASVDLAIHEIERQRTALATYQAEIDRLQEDTNVEVAELRQQLAQLDADNAAMIRRNRELVAALDIATGAAPAVAKPVAVHTNGHTNGAQPPISNLQSSMWDDPNILTTLDDEATDWWIGCAAGRHTWRTVPKPVQLRMVRYILSFGPESGAMKMTDFDAIKPDWMPGSTSHTKTLNLSWSQLNDWSVEL